MAAVDDVDQLIEQFHLAQGEVVKGNPEPVKRLFSHREDVTSLTPSALPCVGGRRLLRSQSVPHRSSETARWLASRS